MADYIVNITQDTQTEIPKGLPSAVSQELQSAGSSSPSSTAVDISTSLSVPNRVAHRWYLKESETESSLKEQTLVLEKEQLPPITTNSAKVPTKWHIPLPSDHVKGAIYDVVLGVSTQNLSIDSIESILFTFEQTRNGESDFIYESEVIKSHELKRLCSKDGTVKEEESGTQGSDADKEEKEESAAQGSDTDEVTQVFQWKLFTQCYGIGDGLTITMDITMWSDRSPDYGSLDLHFVELCHDSSALYRADTLYREHRPYASWMIDINRSGYPEYDRITTKPKHTKNYSLSGDGRFAALVTVMEEDNYLEVWDLVDYDIESKKTGDSKDGDSKDGGNVEVSGNEDESLVLPKQHRATPVAWMLLPKTSVDISISWDGSLVAVMDTTQPDSEEEKTKKDPVVHQSVFAVYECNRIDSGTSGKSSSRMDLVRLDVEKTCPGLKNYVGNGVFHHIETSNQEPKDQLFVTCNGITIDIYSAFETWTPLRSIVMDPSISQSSDIGNTLFKQLRGRYVIASNEETGHASTFDIVLGTMVSVTSALTLDQMVTMKYFSGSSDDGWLVAITGQRHVSVYRSTTWTLLGSYVFHELASNERPTVATFMCNDTLLAVDIGAFWGDQSQRRPGYILNVDTMSVIDRTAPMGAVYMDTTPMKGSSQGLAYLGHTRMWQMRLEDRIYQSFSAPFWDKPHCVDSCCDMDSLQAGVEEATSSFGLHFKAQSTDISFGSHLKREKTPSLTVTVTDTKSAQVKTMVVPFPIGCDVKSAAFFADCRYLLVVAGDIYLAWSVPTSFDRDFRLLLAHYHERELAWTVCQHGIISCRYDGEETISCLTHITLPLSQQLTESFIIALELMVKIYAHADAGLKQDIVRYYSKYLNIFPDPDANALSVLPFLAELWSPGWHLLYCEFLTDLLSATTNRWMPRYYLDDSINPLAILLDKADTQPLANVPVKIIIDYCLRQAKADEDPHFLMPIKQCLHRLVDSKQSYSEIAQHVYREMAFFPARDRVFIIGHHILANPVTFRWRFWRPYPWGLHQYKDQVLQLDMEKTPNPPKGNFTRGIFHASFDMLWRTPQTEQSQDNSDTTDGWAPIQTLFSWPQAIWTMILRKCRLSHSSTIECYPFELEALDNPALKALVEYKWNTIGFKYWLVRFLGQCLYYALVLIAVFLQIYGDDSLDRSLEGLFIAITVIASIFLWLELIQLFRDKQDYLRSVYNVVDLFAFLLPVAGGIIQICVIEKVIDGPNPEVLSFSVLFIFLHFLFELRVFQSVCHFVSIIIRAISSIRVFFFVFAGGLLAFSIAILHLLHTCINEACPYVKEGFSKNLFRALSVTYFMMGGSYDPVEGGFSSDSFAFHMMMVIFFFFTVILMLNVLIALINNAIDDGDQTWQLDWMEYRMRYVESAENMTYDIPGFRDNHNYFPDSIYYTATGQQVRDYKKETQRLADEAGSTTNDTAAAVTVATVVQPAVADQKSTQLVTFTATKDEGTDEEDTLMSMLKQQQEDQTRREKESDKKIKDLQQQLTDQQQMLAQILAKLG